MIYKAHHLTQCFGKIASKLRRQLSHIQLPPGEKKTTFGNRLVTRTGSVYHGSCLKPVTCRWAAPIIFFLTTMMLQTAPAQEPTSQPVLNAFAPGERLHYRLKWSLIPAGEAIMEVLPIEEIESGEKVYHFRLTVTSNSFVDVFYKVRDRIDGYTDLALSRSLRYSKKQEEGDTHRNVVVAFDWPAGIMTYQDEKKSRVNKLVPGSFDPLSIIYYARSLSFHKNEVIERSVTDGNKTITARAKVVKKEKIKIDGVQYDTFLLEPEIEQIGGVFEKDPNAKIRLWITSDHRHIPVKIASRVAVGSFIGELQSVHP